MHNIRLDQDGRLILRVDDGQPADADALRRALGGSPVQLWTGVMVTDKEKGTGFGNLDYFLAAPSGLCRPLTRSPDHGLVAGHSCDRSRTWSSPVSPSPDSPGRAKPRA